MVLQKEIDTLAERITEAGKNSQSPLLVAVCGGTSTGKSSMISKPLAQLFGARNCTLIELDNFQKGREFKNQCQSIYGYDNPDYFAVDQCAIAIKKLLAEKKAELPVYDFALGKQSETYVAEAKPVIIYEGLFAGYGELAQIADLIIYVESCTYARLLRRMYRNMHERYNAEPFIAFKNFFSTLHAHNYIISVQKQFAGYVVYTPYKFETTLNRFSLAPLSSNLPEFAFSFNIDENTSFGVHIIRGKPHFALIHKHNLYLNFEITPDLFERMQYIDYGSR